MVQIYENYLQANAAAFPGGLEAPRQFFVDSLGEVIYTVPGTGFTLYGNTLLLEHVPYFSSGGSIGLTIDQ